MQIKKYAQLYWLQALIKLVTAGFVAVLYVHFFKQHITLAELLLAEGLGALSVCVYILVCRTFSVRRDIRRGFAIFGVGLGLLLFPFSRSLFFVYTILRTLGNIIFYIPYNILFFADNTKETSLRGVTHYWIVGLLVGIVAPLIGAALFVYSGIFLFIVLAIVILFIGIFYAGTVSDVTYAYTTREVLNSTRSLRSIIAIDGALHKVISIVSIFALLYFHTEFQYGGFLSLMSFVALFFMLYIAKVSDGSRQRMAFIWPLSLFLALVSVLFGFLHSVEAFVVLTILLGVFSLLVEPLRGNILLDHIGNLPVHWISRELWLNVGRAGIFIVAFLFLRLNSPVSVFIFCAALHAAFPFLVHYKRIYATAR